MIDPGSIVFAPLEVSEQKNEESEDKDSQNEADQLQTRVNTCIY